MDSKNRAAVTSSIARGSTDKLISAKEEVQIWPFFGTTAIWGFPILKIPVWEGGIIP